MAYAVRLVTVEGFGQLACKASLGYQIVRVENNFARSTLRHLEALFVYGIIGQVE